MAETLKLNHPVALEGGRTLAELTISEPEAGEVIDAQKGNGTPAEKELALLARATKTNPEDLRRLKYSDYKRAVEVLDAFFE